MQNLHEGLRKDSHMKHGGRMQYGLFLKGVGLGVEDALAFWGKAFSKKFTPEDFLKKYAYNIRHNYGKEGNRKDYTSYSCVRIIGGTTPGPGDYHGCPYKHWDQLQLKTTLGRMRLTTGAVEDIMASIKTKDYQTACRKQFDARFQGADNGPVGNHPNAYTEQALAFIKAQQAKVPGGAGAGAKAGAGAGAAPSPAVAAVAETPAP
jgi:DNA primase large subunit